MLSVFFRFSRIITTLLLTAIILFCYANLPESIAYDFGKNGKPQSFTDKQTFFYTVAGCVFIINIGFLFLKNSLIKIDFIKLFPGLSWSRSQTLLKALISTWIDAFLVFINVFMIFAVLGLNNINSRRDQSLDFNYNILIIIGSVGLLILLFYIPIRLLFSEPKPEAS